MSDETRAAEADGMTERGGTQPGPPTTERVDVAIDPRSLHLLVELAHQQPHLHAYNGQEVGHHRLYAMLASGLLNAGDSVRCGLGSPHPPHEWLEAQLQVLTCESAPPKPA